MPAVGIARLLSCQESRSCFRTSGAKQDKRWGGGLPLARLSLRALTPCPCYHQMTAWPTTNHTLPFLAADYRLHRLHCQKGCPSLPFQEPDLVLVLVQASLLHLFNAAARSTADGHSLPRHVQRKILLVDGVHEAVIQLGWVPGSGAASLQRFVYFNLTSCHVPGRSCTCACAIAILQIGCTEMNHSNIKTTQLAQAA